MRRLVVVCTANRCRSPMAEALLRARLRAEARDDVLVSSAGTWAQAGLPAVAEAVQALAELGIDLAGHRSREITGADMTADLILVMTADQRAALRAEFPAARGQLLLFSALAGGGWDIADPVGQPLAAHRATAAELARLLDAGWGRILGEAA